MKPGICSNAIISADTDYKVIMAFEKPIYTYVLNTAARWNLFNNWVWNKSQIDNGLPQKFTMRCKGQSTGSRPSEPLWQAAS